MEFRLNHMSSTPSLNKPDPVNKRGILGWMFFDWAAQPFFTVVLTFIFGPYFVSRLHEDAAQGQATWAYTVTISGIAIAILSPVLGSIADATGGRKKWIAGFACLKISALLLLWFAAPGSAIWVPMLCIILATIAAEFSIVFNDSMMPRLVSKDEVGRISNMAWGLGYAGGLVALFIMLLLLAGSPTTGKTLLGISPLFGLDPALGEDARVSGPLSACWYLLFILPMFLFTADTRTGLPLGSAVKTGLHELAGTLSELKQRVGIVKFLVARMIYQDGINGLLALGGTFAAGMFGWKTIEMGIYGILLLVVAIFGCYLAGKLDSRFGSKKVVMLSLVCLIIATIGIISTAPSYTFFGLIQLSPEIQYDYFGGRVLFGMSAEKWYIGFGLLIGLAFGPAQASSRSYLARSVSVDEAGRYFGIYALSGRATSFAAPLAVALITTSTGSARAGMVALVVFLIVGFVLLLATPYPANDSAKSVE